MRRNLLLMCLPLLTAISASAYDFEAKNEQGTTLYFNKNADAKSVSLTYKCMDVETNMPMSDYSGHVVIPSQISDGTKTYSVTAIGDYAFFNCEELVKVTVPYGITSVGDEAFSYTHLGVVSLPSSITSIGNGAFTWCTLTSITFSESLTSLGESVFAYCEYLKEVTFPGSLTYIPKKCFYESQGIEKVILPNSIITIGEQAFAICSNLQDIEFPASLTTIKESAFWWCNSLKNVELPNSVVTLEAGAFTSCESLESVTLPRYISTIGNGAFSDDTALKTVAIRNHKPSTITMGMDVFANVPFASCKLTVPEGSESLYAAAPQWKDFKNIKTVPNYDFAQEYNGKQIYYFINPDKKSVSVTYKTKEGVSYSGHVIIPTSVTNGSISYTVNAIDDYAFYNCEGLNDLYIPSSVTSIGKEAFRGCTNLSNTVIPNTVTSIGERAFQDCDAFTQMILPPGIKVIPEYMCYNCDNIEEIYIPAGVTSLGHMSFFGCNNLKMIKSRMANPPKFGTASTYLPWSNTKSYMIYCPSDSKVAYRDAEWGSSGTYIYGLPHYDFSDAGIYYSFNIDEPQIVTVTYNDADTYNSYSGTVSIPASLYYQGNKYYVNYIGERAFYKSTGLTSLNCHQDIRTFADEAFAYCSKLTDITLPENLESIGNSCFSFCSSLATLNLPEKVLKSIGANAFLSCSKITDFTLPLCVNEIGDEAFYSCTALRSLTVENSDPANITLGSNVFKGVPTADCALYVPEGSKALYAAAPQWKDFLKIYEPTTKGDVNGDGKINGTDIGLVISYILGKNPTDFNFDAADLDDSGNINGSDIGLIIKIILGK